MKQKQHYYTNSRKKNYITLMKRRKSYTSSNGEKVLDRNTKVEYPVYKQNQTLAQ